MLEYALMAYYLLTSAYILYAIQNRSSQHIILAVVAALLPFLGLLLALIAACAMSRQPHSDTERFVEAMGANESYRNTLVNIDVAKELNVIPLEEALVVNDHRTRRRIVLDALKDDSIAMIPLLNKATRNDDTETSHYAVAAIMELKRIMLAELQKISVAYENNPSDVRTLEETAAVLKHYLNSDLMDRRMERTYRRLQADVLGGLIEMDACSEEQFEDKVECELILERFDKARDSSIAFLEKFPESEAAYYVQLKLWYRLRSAARFTTTLEALKQSPIQVSQRTLQLIRYWNKGAHHV
ncbi:hypothetical protein PAECIP111893_04346 [Paenibacillus plantiphilus]|uniref:Uncharacterized protein n=1 Tax=Paenibacillus plantiphilus TaxID=2905650 RepID=A0ABN8GYG4_9BACL|nr:hypothetical protein [Paenibacillus plantiphilus]CAH1218009.1 hypothetical protein PAECIP111893_04346 [Paenibacillus plantiphilus]